MIDLPDGFVSGLPNCGVTAVAIATGSHYQDVWEWFRTRGKGKRSNWRGRTELKDYLPALKYFGRSKSYETFDCKGFTVEKFASMHTVKGQVYIIRVAGHVMTVKDGLVIDNISKAPVPATDHPKSRCRVKNVFVVC